MRILYVAAVAAALLLPRAARGEDIVFFVGGNEEKGKELAAAAKGKYTKENVAKAFGWAAEALTGKEEKHVVIKIASGTYGGQYALPHFNNAKGSLRVQGGWDETFSKRDPFGAPTRFVCGTPRTAPMIEVAAKDELRSFILDGLLLDAAPGNKYDAKTNSLLKGESCTQPLVRFPNFTVEEVAFENCVFMNSAHRVTEFILHAKDDKAEVRLYNSIFFNCIIPIKLDSARGKHIPAKMVVDHCSFITNFAFNPDKDTSNPAALECAGKYAAHEIVIQDSLFYANFGGGISNIEKVQTKVTIKNNNFVGNGLLHGLAESDAAALIGQGKAPLPVKKIVDAEDDPTLAGNVSISPGLPIVLGDPKGVDASKVKEEKGWENEARRLLGKPIQGGKVDIKDYAPRKEYDEKNPPFPTEEGAKKYGASPSLVK